MSTLTTLTETAEHLIRRRGVDGFSFADLAAVAHIKKPSVHHYFPTKADMVEHVLSAYQTAFWDRLAQTPTLDGLVAAYQDALHDGSQMCLCLALTSTPHATSATAKAALFSFQSKLVAWVADVAGVSDQRATVFVSTLQGAQILARGLGQTDYFETVSRTALADLKG